MGVIVLVADDDPVRSERVRNLVERAGARPLAAGDRVEAMVLFVRCAPDLTLVQDGLSADRGVELCKDMKTLRAGRGRTVVLLAARRPGSRRAALESACDACVQQPFEDATLIRTVRRLLSIRRGAALRKRVRPGGVSDEKGT